MAILPMKLTQETIAAAVDGDLDAIEAVAHARVEQLYAWCARLGGPQVDAEEAAHDVLMLFVRRHGSLQDATRLDAWLFSTCRKVVANHRRRAWWRRWLPGAAPEAPVWPDREEADRTRAVHRVLGDLSVGDREVLTLCYLEDRSIREAADILGVSEGTVKSRLHTARERFRLRCRKVLGEEIP